MPPSGYQKLGLVKCVECKTGRQRRPMGVIKRSKSFTFTFAAHKGRMYIVIEIHV
jgi:hypothetical protein